MTGEPGSPLLSGVGDDGPERFPDADTLARRVHQLRNGAGLDCEVACGSLDGAPLIPCVLIWIANPRRLLAAAVGPGVNRPDDLLAALGRTAVRRAA